MCPNWCLGNVKVKGEPSNIRKFCKLFLFDENNENKKKYFARSFIHSSWNDFYETFLGEKEAEFDVDFAWSCYSCMIEGYPQKFKECVTLEWACKEFDVEVEIETEEGGLGFEEEISYTKENGLKSESKDMPTYRCSCGNEQQIPSIMSVEDVSCYECEEYGKFTLMPSEN